MLIKKFASKGFWGYNEGDDISAREVIFTYFLYNSLNII